MGMIKNEIPILEFATEQVSSFNSAIKRCPIYVTQYKGEEIVLCQAPVGAAAAVQIKAV